MGERVKEKKRRRVCAVPLLHTNTHHSNHKSSTVVILRTVVKLCHTLISSVRHLNIDFICLFNCVCDIITRTSSGPQNHFSLATSAFVIGTYSVDLSLWSHNQLDSCLNWYEHHNICISITPKHAVQCITKAEMGEAKTRYKTFLRLA